MNQQITDAQEAVTGLYDKAIELVQTVGLDFAKNLVIAIVIFYVGKWAVALVVRGVRLAMQRAEVDDTLESFVCNLLRMGLMVFVIIAAINRLGVQTA